MFKSDLLHLKDSSVIFITDIFTSISGLIFSLALARILPTQSYGEYKFVLSALSVLYICSLPGIKTAITQSVAEGYNTSLQKGAYLSFKISLIGSLFALFLAFHYRHTAIGTAFLIISLLFPFIYTPSLYVDYLKGVKLFKKNLYLSFVATIIPTGITLIIAYFLRSFPVIIFSFFSLTAIINSIFLFHYINKNKTTGHIIDKEIGSFGIKLTVMRILNIIRAQFDMLIIGPILGFSSLAIYSIAATFVNQLKGVGLAINDALLPRLSLMNNKKTRYDITKKRLAPYLLLMGIISALLFIAVSRIIPFLFSEKYLASIRLSKLLIVSMFIASPSMLVNTLFQSGKEAKKIIVLNNSIALLEILLLFIYVCVLKFGLNGVILTKFITRGFGSVISFYLLFASKIKPPVLSSNKT